MDEAPGPKRNVLAYFRARPAEPEASAAALHEQREQFTAWLRSCSDTVEVVREVVEDEGVNADRPILAEAIAWCRLHDAAIVIIRTEPIGAGPFFHPRIASVPVIVLPPPVRPHLPVSSLPAMPVPVRDRPRIALYFGRINCEGMIPIYLANLTGQPLTDVSIQGRSLFLDRKRMIPTNGTVRTIDRIEVGMAHLVEHHDPQTAGDYLDMLHITIVEGETVLHGMAVFGAKIRENQFLRVSLTSAEAAADR